MNENANRTVAVIGTGGTISSVGKHSLDLVAYPDNQKIHEIDELLDVFPEARAVADVHPVRFRALGSPKITPDDWLELAGTIQDLAQDGSGVDGIAVTHGTSSLEETAYFLNLTLKIGIPVVLVGAQRPSSGLGTDAGINLLNAIRVAAEPASRGRGVLAMLNDEIHAARDVTKTSTLRVQTFKSPDFGLLGHADADRIVYYRSPVRRCMPDTEFDLSTVGTLPRVDIAFSYAGADGAAVDAFVTAGAKGIVSAGFAPGFCTPGEQAALEAAEREGVVVVQSSRAGSGRVVPLNSMRAANSVLADNLTPQKARVLLMLALTRSCDPAVIQRMFDSY